MPSIYVWPETCSSMPHFLRLQHRALEVAVELICAPQSSGFQERCARRSVEARNSSRPASSFPEMGDPRQIVILTIYVYGDLTLAICFDMI